MEITFWQTGKSNTYINTLGLEVPNRYCAVKLRIFLKISRFKMLSIKSRYTICCTVSVFEIQVVFEIQDIAAKTDTF